MTDFSAFDPLALLPHGKFAGDSLAELLVAGEAGMIAQTDDAGSGGEGMFGQLMDAHIHHQLGIFQNVGSNLLLCCAELAGLFSQLQQCTAHGISSFENYRIFYRVLKGNSIRFLHKNISIELCKMNNNKWGKTGGVSL